MTTVYVVKLGEQYLCHAEDGDIGMSPEMDGAMSFPSKEEAESVASAQGDPGYEIVPVSVKTG